MRSTGSPFKFLEPYDLDDAHLFFGREIETKVLLADILTTRLVVLFARTGTGKTSLINAGVRPVLHDRGYRTFFIRVTEDPVSSARFAIEHALGQPLAAGKGFPEQLEDLAADQPVVLFFDQFEEFFLYVAREDPDTARAFVSDLADIADSDADVHVVFSMREEFLAEMEIFREEIPTIFAADSNLRLRWFNRDQAAAAITLPLGAFDASAEPALVERIIDDLTAIGLSLLGTSAETPIEPAQLQVVCDTAWRARGNGELTLARYLELGRPERLGSVAEQILDQRLVEEFERFDDEHDLELICRLLPELHTARGTKWVREIAELARTIGTDEPTLRALLARLGESGLVDVVARKDAEFVELVHDYLAEPRRVEALRRAIRAIWPLRLLRRALPGLLEDAPLPAPDDLAKVLERVDELPLSPIEGEALLRWALRDITSDTGRVLPAVERSGAELWRICADRLEHAHGDETMHVLETLGRVEDAQAAALLERAVRGRQALAERVVAVLGGIASTRSVDLLAQGLERPEIRADAQQALARLVASWGVPAVGERAAETLGASLAAGTASPEVEEALSSLAASRYAAVAVRALPLLAMVEEVASVRALERRLDDPAVAAAARAGLRRLRKSSRSAVANAAAKALGDAPVPPVRDEPARPPRERPKPPPSGLGVSESVFDSHLRVLADQLGRGRVVPFLGAGANLMGRPDAVGWTRGRDLPSGFELAEHLAEWSDYPPDEAPDLPRVAQYIEVTMGRAPLYDALHQVFDVAEPSTRVHHFLAAIPRIVAGRVPSFSYPLIMTANFDDALERAFAAAGEEYDLLVYAADGEAAGKFVHVFPDGDAVVIDHPLEYTNLAFERRAVILKLHGGVSRADEDRDSFAVTEDDFVDYLLRSDISGMLPAAVVARMRRSSFLFLGYGLRDWTLRAILRQLWADQRLVRRSWAVMRDPSPIDQRLWQARGVDVIDAALEEYVDRLERALIEA